MPSKKSEVKVIKRENNSSRLFPILIGVILITIALAIPVSTFVPVFKAEVNYQLNKNNQPSEIIPVDPQFDLIIPKINANSKVIKNVDPFDSKIYQPALSRGVAHAKNSSTPNAGGNTFIFAHSAGSWYQANQFNAVFYLLDKLVKGDEVIVYYQNQKYIYLVQQTKLINSNEISYLSASAGKNQLTLMTCWPAGTTLKRLIVIATLQKVN
jgi:LPXTG-site transpeptidase (sortase) family protein